MNFKISCLVICASLASSLNSCKRRGEETRAPGQAVAPATSTATPDSTPNADQANNTTDSSSEVSSGGRVSALNLVSSQGTSPMLSAVPDPTVTPSNPYVINVKEYGAKGDGAANDADAIKGAYLAATQSGKPLYLPTGNYYVGTTQLNFLLTDVRNTGVTIYGDGVGRTIINAAAVTTSPQVLFNCTSKPCDQVFLSIKEIGFFTNTTGTGVQFGSQNYSDPINEPKIDLMVLNFSKAATAVAVEMNFVLNGEIRLVANTAAAGTSLRLRQAKFNHFTGSYGGPGGTSVHLTAGFNGGNVFSALDMENVAVCVRSDNPQSQANTFIGGTWNYSKFGVVSTAGRRLVVINPEVNPSPPAKVANFVGAGVGLAMFPAAL